MPHDAHDSLAKSMFSKVEYAADEFRIALPAEIVKRVDLAALTLCPGSFVSPDLRKQHTDLLYTAPLDGRDAFLYLLLEHQSTVHWRMPHRILKYLVSIWDRYISEHPQATKLPVIIPLVLHHSETGWIAPTRFSELYDLEADTRAALNAYLLDSRFIVDDLSTEDDEELRARTVAGAVKLTRQVLKRKDWSTPQLRQWLNAWRDVLIEVERTPGGVEALSKIARYLVQYGETNPESFKRVLIECAGETVSEAFMTTAEQLVQRGLEQGQLEMLRTMLTKQLRWRFDDVPTHVITQIEHAEPSDLERWTERFAKSDTLEQIFS